MGWGRHEVSGRSTNRTEAVRVPIEKTLVLGSHRAGHQAKRDWVSAHVEDDRTE